MSKLWYPSGLALMYGSGLAWTTQNYSAVLLRTTYNYDASHHNLNDITSGHRIGTAALSTKTIDAANGYAKATDPVFTAVPFAAMANAIVVYKNTGVESTSTLLFFCNEGSNVPTLGWGGDMKWKWSPLGAVISP